MVKKRKSTNPKRIFLIAGEPSGDHLGANLMAGLSSLYPEVVYFGVGGPAMIDQGLDSTFPYDELSVMGIVEVLNNLPGLVKRKNQLIKSILDNSFDAVITIDSPDFTLRVARGIKHGGFENPVVHYVAPTVWAWRRGRVKKIRESVDHILTLFPFENEVLKESNISSTFVGHPIASMQIPNAEEISQVAQQLGLEAVKPTLLILPGSRPAEIAKMGPVFAQAGQLFKQAFPDYQLVVAPRPGLENLLQDTNKFNWPENTRFLEGNWKDNEEQERMKLALFTLSDLAMASSGTVSLELAATSTPMVIGYDLNWLSRQIIGSMLLVDTVTLVNLITSTRTVSELLGKNLTPENMFAELKKLASNPSEQKAQMEVFAQTMLALGRNNPNQLARPAEAVADFIQNFHC